MKYVNITPINVVFGQPEATKMQVTITSDNLSNSATFGYHFLTEEGTQIFADNILCEGSDYLSWDGNNNFPYTFTAGTIGVHIISISSEE